MSDTTKVLSDALELLPDARAALAVKLIDSLDPIVDEDAEAQWAEEIERRLADVEAGRVTRVPWSEVRAALLRE